MQIVYFLIVFVVVVAIMAFVIQRIAKAGLRGIERIEKRQTENNNPYIRHQKVKDANDELYEQYLEWMLKNSEGVPVDKVKFKEDEIANKKIKKLF